MKKQWICKCACGPRKGQTIVFFAVASLVLMGMLGLALDAGYDFTQRRTMQNAADAAALYGANMVYQNVSAATLNTNARTLAIQNGLKDPATNSTSFSCRFMDNNGNDRGDCSSGYPGSGSKVTGVKISISETHPTFVMRVLGIATSKTGATATAYAQSLSINAPLIVCAAYPGLGPGGTGPDIIAGLEDVQSGGTTLRVLPDNKYPAQLNPDAIGQTYLIHAPNDKKQFQDCDIQGSSWMGLKDDSASMPTWDPWHGTNISGMGGDHGSNVETWVEDYALNKPCDLMGDGCLLALPIADETPDPTCTDGGNDKYCLHIVRWALFMTTQPGSASCPTKNNGGGGAGNKFNICGTLLPDAVVQGFGSLTWQPGSGPATIRLSK